MQTEAKDMQVEAKDNKSRTFLHVTEDRMQSLNVVCHLVMK